MSNRHNSSWRIVVWYYMQAVQNCRRVGFGVFYSYKAVVVSDAQILVRNYLPPGRIPYAFWRICQVELYFGPGSIRLYELDHLKGSSKPSILARTVRCS